MAKNRQTEKKTSGMTTPMWKRIDDFVKYNSWALVAMVALSFLYVSSTIGDLADTVEKTLVKNTRFIRENIGHPIFLSATGQVVVAEKTPLSFSDARIREYILNSLFDNLVAGTVRVSKNYKVQYSDGDDILKRYNRFRNFYGRFLHGDPSQLRDYAKNLYLAITEDTLPNYINVVDSHISNYQIKKVAINEGGDGLTHISGMAVGHVVVKSWIADLNQWDTRETMLNIRFSIVADPAKYADIGNPFGFFFTDLDIPITKKPTARSIINEKR